MLLRRQGSGTCCGAWYHPSPTLPPAPPQGLRSAFEQRQLPLLRIQAPERLHNRRHALELVVGILMSETPGLDPSRIALPAQGQRAFRFGNLFGQGDHGCALSKYASVSRFDTARPEYTADRPATPCAAPGP